MLAKTSRRGGRFARKRCETFDVDSVPRKKQVSFPQTRSKLSPANLLVSWANSEDEVVCLESAEPRMAATRPLSFWRI